MEDRIVALIEQFKINPKSCLDVGCKRGDLLKHLEVYFFARILGLEYDHELPEIDEVVYNKDDVHGKFDLVTCIRATEHMNDIEWMASKLNEGGTLLLEVIELPELTLPHICLEHENFYQILIGDRYEDATSQKVYYSFESPDFDNKKDYGKWLQNSYNQKG